MEKNICRLFLRFCPNFIARRFKAKKMFSVKQRKSQVDLAINVFEHWLKIHPDPDEKFAIISGCEMSPREFVDEIKSGSRASIDYVNSMIEMGLREMIRKLDNFGKKVKK
jgi:hypothetical protein